jgi:hypothetical protein
MGSALDCEPEGSGRFDLTSLVPIAEGMHYHKGVLKGRRSIRRTLSATFFSI